MFVHLRALFLCVLFCAAVSTAQADVVSWMGATYAKSHVLKPKKSLEVCADVAAKQSVAWKFSADGELNFNVHRHEGVGGKDVIYDVEATRIRERSGTLVQPLAYEWCWMWTNVSAKEVTVQVSLQR